MSEKMTLEQRAEEVAFWCPESRVYRRTLEHLRAAVEQERERGAWIARDHRHSRYCFEEYDVEACSCQEGIALKIEDPKYGPVIK